MRNRIARGIAVAALCAAPLQSAELDPRLAPLAYFTTGGFYTVGTVTPGDGELRFHEFVRGSTPGSREVKATSRILPDGRLHVKSKHLKDGQWVDVHEVRFSEDPKAVVRFKD